MFKSLSAAQRRSYGEDNTRKDFILPLFRALKWDIHSSAEVSAEERVSRGWVDFAFRISGIPRFFLETKRIAEDLTKQQWVKQAIDYAWTKSVTWALLSDFEGLRVFNAEWKEDNPLRAQFIEFSVDTYLPDFERLWWLSKPEMARGTLDSEAEKVGKKALKEPVSQQLFDDLKEWRRELFRHLHAYNKRYSPAQIDEAVLRILNRLIFVRAAEDREVEARRLLPLLRELDDRRRIGHLPAELAKLFREFDAVYDSDLFAEHFSEKLDCEPEPFRVLIEGLHEKRGGVVRYNFNAIDADVLGTVYEQYLGHVIADPKAAEVVEKRKKRKAQGIYYTPTFVVKYIVQQTLGRYLTEHGYNPARPVRVLDMACGSGSFLIEAFDVLDRHLARERGQARGNREDVIDYARRMEILSKNIYGVDKDEQAVAVARLNLLLKALHMRDKLPMLHNIRVGDSLISGTPDELRVAFEKDWRAKKPFNWEAEFQAVMKDGGFDVIVGNPPYVRAENMPRDERDYYMSGCFEVAFGRFDIHILFVERAIKLLKKAGRLGFIMPYAGLTQNYGIQMRKLILDTCVIESIVDLSEYKVFETASVATGIVILRKESDESVRRVNKISVTKQKTYDDGIKERATHFVAQSIFHETPHHTFRLDLNVETMQLLRKIDDRSLKLGDVCYLITGAVLHDPKTGASKERLLHNTYRRGYQPYIEAKEIARYVPPVSSRFMDYNKANEMHRPKFPELFENDKLMIARIASEVVATLDTSRIYTDHTINLAVRKDSLISVENRSVKITEEEAEAARRYNLHYLLGLINSKLATFYLRRLLGMAIEINPETARSLPICRINFDNLADKKRHDAIVARVEEMLQLQKGYAEAERNLEDRRHTLKRRIEEVDAAIDRMVYELYDLTEEEIAVVEGRS